MRESAFVGSLFSCCLSANLYKNLCRNCIFLYLLVYQCVTSETFGEIRTCQVNNQIMFVGKDVAKALGYAKPQNALATHVDSEDKSTAPIQGTAYETRVTLISTERVAAGS